MFDLSEGVFVGRYNSHWAGIHWQELQRAYWGCYLHDFLPSQHLMHWWLWWQGLHLSVLHVWKFQTFSNVSANHIPSWLHKSDPKIFGIKEHGNTSVTPVFFVATKGIRCLMGARNKAFTKSYRAVISLISNAFTCDFWLQVIVWKMDGMIIRTMRPPEHDLKDIEYKTIISLIFCRDLVIPQTPLPDCVYCNKEVWKNNVPLGHICSNCISPWCEPVYTQKLDFMCCSKWPLKSFTATQLHFSCLHFWFPFAVAILSSLGVPMKSKTDWHYRFAIIVGEWLQKTDTVGLQLLVGGCDLQRTVHWLDLLQMDGSYFGACMMELW